jgi:hypothetical protein
MQVIMMEMETGLEIRLAISSYVYPWKEGVPTPFL